ncbi:MAG: T9SS type A sorting domain-containing protein [Ignavibacteriaceae bacterium]|nr:T9SS type A sorting domain-containing protein [Ignavibacteriaceae bacterium]
MKKERYLLVIILMFTIIYSLSAFAQMESPSPQVFKSIYNDTSPPLRDMPEAPLSPTPWKDGIIRNMSKEQKYEDQYQPDESLQEIMGGGGDGFILQSWDGIGADGYAPPDQSGDVGPNHYMEVVNVRFQIWNKTGTSLLGPLNLGTIWSGFPGPWSSSLNDGDPIVLYDEAAGRWFVAQFSLPNYPNGPFYILIAVSQTGNPTGSWHRYGFSFTHMPDYPKFGVWPDGYYMSANSFSSGSLNYNGTYVAAFDRSQMLNGNTATMVSFLNSPTTTWSLLPSDWNGTVTPPSGAPNYFGQIHDNAEYGGNDGFDIYQFHVDWVTPANSTFTGPTFLATNAFSTVNGIPQLGTSQLLDNLSVMTMNRLDYRNFGTHQSMVVCHTIDAGSSRAGVRWYEFRNTGSGWSIYQQGTYAPADGLERWMGSIALNSSGDIALGYSVSSSTMYPSIRYTGRMAGDPLGVMTLPEETIQAGLGAQTGLSRWGDYTQMVADPDGKTFWYVNQYQPSTGSFNWKTRIASMSFGISDPTNVTATPVSYSQINVGFTPNSNNNNVIIVWNLTGIFTTPTGAPPAVGQQFAGGTLLYNGTVSPVSHTGLNPQTSYYYKLFSYDGSSYSTGVATNATTLNISNPSNVSANPISSSQINVGFTPNSSNNNVIVVWNLTGSFTTPTGTPPAVGQSFAGGTLLYNGIVSPVQHTGLNPQTTYYYKLFSYDGSVYSTGVTTNATTFNIADPSNVTVTPVNQTQIDIGFTPNSNNNNVVIVWNLTGVFSAPAGIPPAIGQPFAGGTLLYNGLTSPVNHTGLTPLMTYHYKLFSFNGSFYSSGVVGSASTFYVLDFSVNLSVFDNCSNSVQLTFGTAAGATDCYDPGLDMSAPPPPPGGAFDGRFVSCNEGFFTDIKATNLTEERIWNLQYQAAEGCSPVTISWNPAQLPANGYFHLVDAVLGTLVNVNMRMTNSYTDVVGIGQLQIKYNYEFCTNYSINTNWNMISLPLGVSNSNYLTLFPNAVQGSLYGYSGGYYSTQNIANCTGYWIKFPSSQLAEVCGTDITECVLNLSSGWNMIGGPNCNVPLSSVIDPGGIIIPGTLYRYSGTYSTANSIDATKAYWVKTSGSGTITVSCGNLLANKESQLVILEDAVSGFGKIEVKDALENSQVLYFNGKLSDEVSIESYSLPPLPPAGGFDARIAGDYRLSESEEVEINLQAGEYPVKVRIENIDFSEDYKVIEILNGSEVGSHRINSGEEIVITNKEVKKLKITKQEMLPATYNLEQNYPNPFNPGTTIKFSLPEASKVTLNIYNTLGEKIAELVNTNLEAGKYSYQWDAGETASGIYIYELRTDKFSSMKKMILLK